MPGAHHLHPAPVRRHRETGEGGEVPFVRALGDHDPLELLQLGDTRDAGDHQGAPGDAQAHPECGLVGTVPADVADEHVHSAVLGLDDVVEVAAEQRLLASGPVAGHDVHFAGAVQHRRRQQSAFEAGVLPGLQPAGLQRDGGVLGLLALDGVAHGAAEQVRLHASLDEIVLRAGGDRRQARLLLGEAGQYHDRDAGGVLLDPREGVHALRVGQMQIQQDAVGQAGVQFGARRGHRLNPFQAHALGAVRHQFLDDERVARVVLDQQDRRLLPGPVGVQSDRRSGGADSWWCAGRPVLLGEHGPCPSISRAVTPVPSFRTTTEEEYLSCARSPTRAAPEMVTGHAGPCGRRARGRRAGPAARRCRWSAERTAPVRCRPHTPAPPRWRRRRR